MSFLEDLLELHLRERDLRPEAREHRFHDSRRWRFDFAWPSRKVAVEVDGGIYCRGRHVRGGGFEGDTEKGNAAVLADWRVLHFTPRMVKTGSAAQLIEDLMRTVREREKQCAAEDRRGIVSLCSRRAPTWLTSPRSWATRIRRSR